VKKDSQKNAGEGFYKKKKESRKKRLIEPRGKQGIKIKTAQQLLEKKGKRGPQRGREEPKRGDNEKGSENMPLRGQLQRLKKKHRNQKMV